jgi:hypothetical protein
MEQLVGQAGEGPRRAVAIAVVRSLLLQGTRERTFGGTPRDVGLPRPIGPFVGRWGKDSSRVSPRIPCSRCPHHATHPGSLDDRVAYESWVTLVEHRPKCPRSRLRRKRGQPSIAQAAQPNPQDARSLLLETGRGLLGGLGQMGQVEPHRLPNQPGFQGGHFPGCRVPSCLPVSAGEPVRAARAASVRDWPALNAHRGSCPGARRLRPEESRPPGQMRLVRRPETSSGNGGRARSRRSGERSGQLLPISGSQAGNGRHGGMGTIARTEKGDIHE